MGTTVSLLLPAMHAGAGASIVRALFMTWETTLSRFLPDSELAHLNRRAGRPVAVSPLLYDVITAALTAARATDGIYDPTLLGQIVRLGYDRSFEALPPALPPLTLPLASGGGWRRVRVEHAQRRVTVPPGIGLDLGGIAKGLAVDAALALLSARAIAPALVNAGGDLAVAGAPPGAAAWPVAVPLRMGTTTVPLHHGAMATSGVARRRWSQGDQARHHLLNPRSGAPAHSGLWSVTVVAARCAQAEVAAKVACVLGPDEGALFIRRQGLAGLLVRDTGEYQTAGTWPLAGSEVGL